MSREVKLPEAPDAEQDQNNWRAEAICASGDIETAVFFSDMKSSIETAKEICASCAVRSDCLEYAMSAGEKFGVWGGLTVKERRRLSRYRAQERGHAVIVSANSVELQRAS